MPVTLVNSWAGTGAFVGDRLPVGGPSPSTSSLVLPVGNLDGHWLICVTGWVSVYTGVPQLASVSVGDDAHNLWYPLGTAQTSTLCSVTVWAAPAARPATFVYVAPTAGITVSGAFVYEFSGLSNGFTPAGFVTASPGSPLTGTSVSLPAPAQSSLIITGGSYDNLGYGGPIVVTGSGWAAASTQSITTGAGGYGYSMEMGATWQVTSGAATANWAPTSTATGPVDVTAVIAGVYVAQAPPTQPSPNWPVVQLQAAFGSTAGGPAGQGTPPDQRVWADISGRRLTWSETRGGQYELDKLEAAEVNVALDNHDGALTPRPPWAITATTGSANATTLTVSSTDAAKLTVGDYFQLYNAAPPAGVPLQSAVFQVTNVASTLVTFTPAAAANPVTGTVAQSGSFTPISLGQVTSFAPVRLLTTWQGRTQASFGGYTERWPQEWAAGSWWQRSNAVFTDVWSLTNATLRSIGEAEILNDLPFAYWPCDDQAGSAAASNIAPANTDPLTVKQCKAGPGNASYAFGVSASAIYGPDTVLSGSSAWQQSGLASQWEFDADADSSTNTYISSTAAFPSNIAVGNHFKLTFSTNVPIQSTLFVVTSLGTASGFNEIFFSPAAISDPLSGDKAISQGDEFFGYCLYYQPSGGQPLLDGVTITAFFNIDSVGSNAPQTLWSLKSAGGPIATLWVTPSFTTPPSALMFDTWDSNGNNTSVIINNTIDWAVGMWFNVTVTLTSTTFTVYPDGGAVAAVSGVRLPFQPEWNWISFGGQADAFTSGSCANCMITQCAIFPYVLSLQRILTQVYATELSLGGVQHTFESFDIVSDRIHRYLQAGGFTGPRCIDITGNTYGQSTTTAATEVAGKQANTAVEDMAASDGGILAITGDGSLFYRANVNNYNTTPKWTLGENTTAGEIPYLPDATVGYDPSLVVNTISLSQQNGVSVSPSNALGPVITASQQRYGSITATPSVFLYDIDAVTDLANWLLEQHGNASLRVEQVTVDAAKTTAAWPLVLYGDIGDVVVFHRRPITGGAPPLTFTTRILRLQRTLDWASGTATIKLTLSPYNGNALATNTAAAGTPNGGVVLAR